MRSKIWYSLVHTKTNEYYTSKVTRYYQWSEWFLNSFLVIATSSGIAAWIIWDSLEFVWIIIIGLSQILTLLKPFLLFPKYVQTYNEKNVLLQQLCWDLEKLWYNFEKNNINEDEAFHEFDKLKKKLIEVDKFPNEVIVITHKKALSQAEEKCNQYINQL